MDKKKLKKLIYKLRTGLEPVESFDELDAGIKQLTKKLHTKIEAKSLDSVNETLETFKKNLDLSPIKSSLEKLKSETNGIYAELGSNIENKANELFGKVDAAISKLEEIENDRNDIRDEISEVRGDVKSKGTNIDSISKKHDKLTSDFHDASKQLNKLIKELDEKISTVGKGTGEAETGIIDLKEKFVKFRGDILTLLSERGGGNMNRQIKVDGVDVLTKYTDINLVAGTGVTLTAVEDITDKNVDITISAGAADSTTLADVSANSTDATKSTYTMGAGIPVHFKSSDGNTLLYLDETNERIGVGTSSVSAKLQIESTGSSGYLNIIKTTSTSGISTLLQLEHMGTTNTGRGAGILFKGPNSGVSADVVKLYGANDNTSGGGRFVIETSANGGTLTERFRIDSSGNVGIGTSSPTNILSLSNSAAQKFWIENSATDVVGRALTVAAGGTIAGTSVNNVAGGGLTLQAGLGTGSNNSATAGIIFQTGIPGSSGTTLQTMGTKMTISPIGFIFIGNNTSTSPILFPFSTTSSANVDMSGTGLAFFNNNAATVNTDAFGFGGSNYTVTSGATRHMVTRRTFAPTSGTATYASFNMLDTINQTGGASGITRSLYVLPTLTAAADYRGVEVDVGATTNFGFYQAGTSGKNYFAGSVGIGATSPNNVLDLGTGTSGRGITWSSSATAQFSNMWSNFSDGSLWLANGYKPDPASVTPFYSYTGTMGRAAIKLDGFTGSAAVEGFIAFYTQPSDAQTINTTATLSERMRILPGGTVGIGQSTATARLEVLGSTVAPSTAIFTDPRTNIHTLAAAVQIINNADTDVGTLFHRLLDLDYAGDVTGTVTGTYIRFLGGSVERAGLALVANKFAITTGGTERFTIDTAGLVGIATTAPDRALEINSATGINLRLTYNDSNGSATNYADLTTSSTGDLTITTAGTNPSINFQAAGSGTFNFKGTATQAAELRLYEDTDAGTNYTAFKVGTQSGNITYTLPTDDGDSGQVLSTDGSGVLDWIDQGGGTTDGWTATGAFTYSSADAPTYVVTVDSGAASIYNVGDRIKLTDSTVKYFIITAITDTTLTLYGGTDYTLSGGAITSPYYSHQKSPLGFPTTPTKWSVTTTSTSDVAQASPVQNTWYNVGSLNIILPIGAWQVSYQAVLGIYKSSSSVLTASITLSTANNSSSDLDLQSYQEFQSGTYLSIYQSKNKLLDIASKTTYYLNIRTVTASLENLEITGARGSTVIRAVCAYL